MEGSKTIVPTMWLYVDTINEPWSICIQICQFKHRQTNPMLFRSIWCLADKFSLSNKGFHDHGLFSYLNPGTKATKLVRLVVKDLASVSISCMCFIDTRSKQCFAFNKVCLMHDKTAGSNPHHIWASVNSWTDEYL